MGLADLVRGLNLPAAIVLAGPRVLAGQRWRCVERGLMPNPGGVDQQFAQLVEEGHHGRVSDDIPPIDSPTVSPSIGGPSRFQERFCAHKPVPGDIAVEPHVVPDPDRMLPIVRLDVDFVLTVAGAVQWTRSASSRLPPRS